jgi:hypothetical protein
VACLHPARNAQEDPCIATPTMSPPSNSRLPWTFCLTVNAVKDEVEEVPAEEELVRRDDSLLVVAAAMGKELGWWW